MAVTPVLKRFDTVVYKPQDLVGGPVVVAPGVVLRFYAQGATVSENTDILDNSTPFTIKVYNKGAIALNDQLLVEGIPPASTLLPVDGIDDVYRVLTVVNLLPVSGTTYQAALGKRLVLVSKPLAPYLDPLGTAEPLSSLTTDTNGRARGYLRNFRFDYTATLDPNNPIVFHDAEGSFAMRC